MSRCTMPAAWAVSTASATAVMIFSAASTGIGPFMIRFFSVPDTRRVAMYRSPSISPMP